MSDKKQSSVDYLISQLQKSKDWYRVLNEVSQMSSATIDIIEQAKVMHREEVKESYREGRSDQQSPRNVHFYHRNAESYYNETFGGES